SKNPSEKSERATRLFFSAQEAYLRAAYEAADERYGSFDGFLEQGLGVGPADRQRLLDMYLE
ncbi:MAG: tyrosine-protein phosphatase, partial [Oscillospiraceae bacterium]|nr:tyrosine-protein phosphatase [Oscillospiraceae bacterium]